MRTTIRLDDQLLRDAKTLAARTGRTLTALVEEGLRRVLAEPAPRTRRQVELPTVGGKGLQPGVDLDDTAALLDLMDGIRDPS